MKLLYPYYLVESVYHKFEVSSQVLYFTCFFDTCWLILWWICFLGPIFVLTALSNWFVLVFKYFSSARQVFVV